MLSLWIKWALKDLPWKADVYVLRKTEFDPPESSVEN